MQALQAPNAKRALSGHTPWCVFLKHRKLPVTGAYVAFTIVRNPWSRAVSAFLYLQRMRNNRYHKPYWKLLGEPKDFTAFVHGLHALHQRQQLHRIPHVQPQCAFLTRDGAAHSDVDPGVQVCHMETLTQDVKALKGLPAAVKKHLVHATQRRLNVSARHAPYASYYTADTEARIATIYACDLARFNYQPLRGA